jgi:hypothetical protein
LCARIDPVRASGIRPQYALIEDRQTLDAAYNNSAAVADSDRYLTDWQRRSEALRTRIPDHLNLVTPSGL